jgi:hypothetical protein
MENIVITTAEYAIIASALFGVAAVIYFVFFADMDSNRCSHERIKNVDRYANCVSKIVVYLSVSLMLSVVLLTFGVPENDASDLLSKIRELEATHEDVRTRVQTATMNMQGYAEHADYLSQCHTDACEKKLYAETVHHHDALHDDIVELSEMTHNGRNAIDILNFMMNSPINKDKRSSSESETRENEDDSDISIYSALMSVYSYMNEDDVDIDENVNANYIVTANKDIDSIAREHQRETNDNIAAAVSDHLKRSKRFDVCGINVIRHVLDVFDAFMGVYSKFMYNMYAKYVVYMNDYMGDEFTQKGMQNVSAVSAFVTDVLCAEIERYAGVLVLFCVSSWIISGDETMIFVTDVFTKIITTVFRQKGRITSKIYVSTRVLKHICKTLLTVRECLVTFITAACIYVYLYDAYQTNRSLFDGEIPDIKDVLSLISRKYYFWYIIVQMIGTGLYVACDWGKKRLYESKDMETSRNRYEVGMNAPEYVKIMSRMRMCDVAKYTVYTLLFAMNIDSIIIPMFYGQSNDIGSHVHGFKDLQLTELIRDEMLYNI